MMFVHRFKWSHEALRKKWKRMAKDGKAKMIRRTKYGWEYAVIKVDDKECE